MPRPSSALIVDDEPHVRLFLRFLLQQLKVTTIWEAVTGVDALEAAARHHPGVVLLDVNLPEMNGQEVLARLGAEHPEIPVVIVSAESALKTVMECRRLGATAYILKHAPRGETLRMLREAFEEIEAAGEAAESGP